jgi:hypothetical protein
MSTASGESRPEAPLSTFSSLGLEITFPGFFMIGYLPESFSFSKEMYYVQKFYSSIEDNRAIHVVLDRRNYSPHQSSERFVRGGLLLVTGTTAAVFEELFLSGEGFTNTPAETILTPVINSMAAGVRSPGKDASRGRSIAEPFNRIIPCPGPRSFAIASKNVDPIYWKRA